MKTKLIVTITAISSMSLAGTLGYFVNSVKSTREPVPEPAPAPMSPSLQRTPVVMANPQMVTNVVRMDWNQVESEDYRKYIANLRAIGCPEQTIRDIIVADVNKLFESREKALAGPKPATEFWKRPQPHAMGEEKLKQRFQLAKEKRALLKELLGADFQDNTPLVTPSSSSEERLGFLPKDKQDQVAELEATYRNKVQALMGNRMRPSKADMEKYNALMAEQEAETARILNPQELEDYQLRSSRTAQIMRMTLGDFEMTEQEFRDVFKIKKQFEDKYNLMLGPGPEQPEKVLARAEMERQIQKVIGDQRYTDYTREQGWATSTLQNVAQDFGVPKETAIKVFDLKPLAQEQAARVQLDSSLTDFQKQEALQAVQQETVKAIAEIIGKEPAEAYYRQGAWIKNLNPSMAQQMAGGSH